MSQAPIETYVQGTTVRVAAKLKDFDGNVVTPNDVRILVKPPTGPTVVALSTVEGTERVAKIVGDLAGTYTYRFENTVDPTTAEERRFVITRRQVPAI